MASILGKIIGARGHEIHRVGSKNAGLTLTAQTFTQLVTLRWEWDIEERKWNVVLTSAPIKYNQAATHTVLWHGTMPE